MIVNEWIKNWVKKKIGYYETYLKDHWDSPIKEEIEESIRILKELI